MCIISAGKTIVFGLTDLQMKKLLINMIAIIAGLSFIPHAFAVPNINRVMDNIFLNQDYFNNCQFNKYEEDIDYFLQTPSELTNYQYSALLSAKSSIHLCRDEHSAEYKIDIKITSLPKDEISNDIYIYALANVGIHTYISLKNDNACHYLSEAHRLINDSTPVYLNTYINQWYSYSCIKDPVEKLTALYKILKPYSVNSNNLDMKKQKETILLLIADEYATIGQFPTAAKIREDAMNIFPDKEGSMSAFQDNYALGTDYLDAGDINSAEKMLEKIIYHASFDKDNEVFNNLSNVFKLKLAYEKRDYKLMIDILDNMGTSINVIEKKHNTNKLSILKAIACVYIGRTPCVENFVSNLDYHKNQIESNDYLLTSFLTRYYITVGDTKNALIQYDSYADSIRKKLLKQQDFNTVLGTAQLHQDLIQLDLNLARTELKKNQLVTMLITGISIILSMMALMFWYSRNRQKHYAETDILSNLLNRRAILKSLKNIKPASNNNHHALVLFDLDKFKMVNDTYGHHIGDKVIQSVAKIANKNIRKNDILGRIGGEEFLLCLTDIPYEEAKKTVERIRKSLEESIIPIDKNKKISITASFSFLLFDVEKNTFEDVFPSLDKGLYRAKDAGRNTVIEVSS
jgi:diguanylate cyclase (GGDEF)-like protein